MGSRLLPSQTKVPISIVAHLSRGLGILALCLGLSACITETSGGMPGPAPVEDRIAAQLDLARGYLENRDWTRAKAPLERALEIDPRNVEAHVLSAVLFHAESSTQAGHSSKILWE